MVMLLAGDVGGTKSLLGLYLMEKGKIRQAAFKRYTSCAWDGLGSMLKDFLVNHCKALEIPQYGCIALAGPVNDGTVYITNLNWRVETNELNAIAKLKQLKLVNDFGILPKCLPLLNDKQQITLHQGEIDRDPQGLMAVVGAGTGLGLARGVRTNSGMILLSSEGGHCEFAPRNQLEWELAKWLKTEHMVNRLSVERVASGTGLGYLTYWLLHQAGNMKHPLQELAEKWRQQQRHPKPDANYPDLPALVSQAATNGDPLAQQALEIWLGIYGAAAGDIALEELPTGGFWVAGGTAAKHLIGLQSDTFVEAFLNKGRLRQALKKITVLALLEPEAGLMSAAFEAARMATTSGC
uniref:Putative glucokinase n=1 Tax=Paulinella chromatophora TaxID=39717 RepID=B1X5R4_PAUCH|nr:Putative glucokinase [Paulinella chromatophora]ACB43283.1 Putative glucokinase [Paulinella chromatophora]|eukprot:gb/GEZN01000800.1/.p1 GENE.gb/GEZN01000800.1/~~gb/GEZN01000800.1/.p1  ORF type:complete len:352 (+),score=2.27 gb/GEZN01000800.1/:628-1683(+)